jgi:hypothetical protein
MSNDMVTYRALRLVLLAIAKLKDTVDEVAPELFEGSEDPAAAAAAYAAVVRSLVAWEVMPGWIYARCTSTGAGAMHGPALLARVLDATAELDEVHATAVIGEVRQDDGYTIGRGCRWTA